MPEGAENDLTLSIIVESPSMSWIDRIVVQIGAVLKKRHGNHTQSAGTSWILWTKRP